MKKDILNYSIHVAMLRHLLIENLISEEEYSKLKIVIMSEYNVISDINS
ncbi:SHOCT domain-containing protein [Paenilisteria weihenstephanensis]|uniref:Conjugal transfer protein n=1 Tax=Listeria weihenstephanensis TaxID=1006155 RepID=A0A1S7FVT8_9LIST|nr:SHOCT domain-containing protein [Listeria weihenstephanensis]AQY51520.1 conjugal transfer protein [Listeria weihenstephanensis]